MHRAAESSRISVLCGITGFHILLISGHANLINTVPVFTGA